MQANSQPHRSNQYIFRVMFKHVQERCCLRLAGLTFDRSVSEFFNPPEHFVQILPWHMCIAAMLELVEKRMLHCHWQFLIRYKLALSQLRQHPRFGFNVYVNQVVLFDHLKTTYFPVVFAFLINFFDRVFMSVYFLWFLCFWAVVFVMRESFRCREGSV